MSTNFSSVTPALPSLAHWSSRVPWPHTGVEVGLPPDADLCITLAHSYLSF